MRLPFHAGTDVVHEASDSEDAERPETTMAQIPWTRRARAQSISMPREQGMVKEDDG